MRTKVIPRNRSKQPRQLTLFDKRGRIDLPLANAQADVSNTKTGHHDRDPSPRRIGWRALLAKAFEIDLATCPKC